MATLGMTLASSRCRCVAEQNAPYRLAPSSVSAAPFGTHEWALPGALALTRSTPYLTLPYLALQVKEALREAQPNPNPNPNQVKDALREAQPLSKWRTVITSYQNGRVSGAR